MGRPASRACSSLSLGSPLACVNSPDLYLVSWLLPADLQLRPFMPTSCPWPCLHYPAPGSVLPSSPVSGIERLVMGTEAVTRRNLSLSPSPKVLATSLALSGISSSQPPWVPLLETWQWPCQGYRSSCPGFSFCSKIGRPKVKHLTLAEPYCDLYLQLLT